jgi:hypothetical protein
LFRMGELGLAIDSARPPSAGMSPWAIQPIGLLPPSIRSR